METKERVQVSVDRKLYSQIKEYCSLNDLKISAYIDALLKDAFMRSKYGEKPFDNKVVRVETTFETDVPGITGVVYPKEVVKEAVKEFPVEEIKTLSAEKGEIPVHGVPADEVPVGNSLEPVGEVFYSELEPAERDGTPDNQKNSVKRKLKVK